MTRRKNPWTGMAWNAWAMGLEASTVIGLRTLKIATGGPAAQAEIDRMVEEKMEAAMTLPMLAMTGQLGATGLAVAARSITHLRKKVRANRRRLLKI